MKLEGNKFYLVDAGGDKWITADENEAIERIMYKFQEDEDLNPEKTGIYEADVSDVEKWEIRQIPRSKVAKDALKQKMKLLTSKKEESVKKFVIDSVREALIEELAVHIVTGQIDYQMRGCRGLNIYFCPHCGETLEEIGESEGKIPCNGCKMEIEISDIEKFTTLSYIIYRFGFQYRDIYENQARRGEKIRCSLPIPPSALVYIAGVISSSIIQGIAWDFVKRGASKIWDKFIGGREPPEQIENIKWKVPRSPSAPYKIFDLMKIIESDEFRFGLAYAMISTLARSEVLAQKGMTPDDLDKKCKKVLEEAGGVIHADEMARKIGSSAEEVRKKGDEILGRKMEKELSNREIEFVSYFLGVSRKEFEGLTESELVEKVISGFLKSYLDAVKLLKKSKILERHVKSQS